MTKLFFLRACPIWTTMIPAASVQEIPDWIAKKLVAGGVAIDEVAHQERIAERAKRKAEAKSSVMIGALLPEKKPKKSGKN